MKNLSENMIKFITENEETIEEYLNSGDMLGLKRFIDDDLRLLSKEIDCLLFYFIFLSAPEQFKLKVVPVYPSSLKLKDVFYNSTQNKIIEATGTPLLPAMFKNNTKVLLLQLDSGLNTVNKERYNLTTREEYLSKLKTEGFNLVMKETEFNLKALDDFQKAEPGYKFSIYTENDSGRRLDSSSLSYTTIGGLKNIASVLPTIKRGLLSNSNMVYWPEKVAVKVVNKLVTEDSIRKALGI